ncbi:hypothetical protein GCM10018955_49680 [Planomonospora venezuelensis]
MSLGRKTAAASSAPTVSTPAASIVSLASGSPQRVSAPSSDRPGMIRGLAAPVATIAATRAATAAAATASASRTVRAVPSRAGPATAGSFPPCRDPPCPGLPCPGLPCPGLPCPAPVRPAPLRGGLAVRSLRPFSAALMAASCCAC